MQATKPRGVRPATAPDAEGRPKPAKLGSAALARLVEEVRVGDTNRIDAYNRTYHRHNR